MTVTIYAIGRQDTDNNGSDDYIWNFYSSDPVDVTYTWVSGGQSGSITVHANSNNLFTLALFEDIELRDENDNIVATGNYIERNAPEVLHGGNNANIVHGHTGNDNLDLIGGNDVVSSGAGDDNIIGDRGNDSLDGGSGADVLDGGRNNDTIEGGTGADTIIGGSGRDLLNGGDGDDVITGGSGNDTIIGGAGNDTIDGQSGNDTIIITANEGDEDVILSYNPASTGDIIDLSAFDDLYFDDAVSQFGNHVQINLGGQTLMLFNTELEDVDINDFVGLQEGSNPEVEGDLIEGAISDIADAERITSVALGDVTIADWNGDGVNDIISSNGGTYGAGIVWFDGTDQSVNRHTYANSDNEFIVDFNGDGVLDVVTDARGGVGYFDGNDNTNFVRITFNDVGNFRVGDMDSDGNMDILGNMGAYANGDAITGAVWYDAEGALTRLTYNDLGNDYAIADIDGDGATEVISNNGFYQNGIAITGLTYYELDGSIERHTFAADQGFKVGNFDEDSGLEILAIDAVYNSGAVAQGATVLQGDHVLSRFTYNNIGDFDYGDIDGDGHVEVFSANGSYNNGASINGIMRYNVDGSAQRILYNNVDDVIVADIDSDGTADLLATGGVFGSGLVRLEMGVANNDELIGTEHNDTIIGGGGDDTLTGGDGNDRFQFGAEFDHDEITDFRNGNSTLVFDSVSGVNDAADVVAAAQVIGSNTVITLDDGSITLNGVDDLAVGDIQVL